MPKIDAVSRFHCIYRLLRLKEETTEKKKIGDRLPLISIAADILGGTLGLDNKTLEIVL